ncbi:MAG TPA: SdrD B-like domain-containing protein [Gemmatimonadales bacterium]|nr:SdrD B-like domain-containing protein [Gemmatimonadales bacterium]
MRSGSGSVLGSRSTLRGIPAAVRVVLLLGLLVGPGARHAQAQGVPAGTQIRSWAIASFVLNGIPFTLYSDTADVLVGQVGGVDLEPPRITSGAINSTVRLPQVITNVGNGVDSFTVAASSDRGWAITLFSDGNEDGQINGADAPVSGPITLGYAGHTGLIAQVTVPNNPALVGLSDTVRVTAVSWFDPSAADSLAHRIDIPSAPLTLSLSKAADRMTALPGDPITYTLSYNVLGSGTTSAFQIQDTVPAGTAYLPGTMQWNGLPLTDASGDDAGTLIAVGNGVVSVNLGAVAAGTAGTVSFQTAVSPGPARTVSNRGHTVFAWGSVIDTVYSNDALTSVPASQLSLAKSLTGPAQATIGQQVQYQLHYANLSGTTTAPGVVLVDTLPAGLDYASATVAPSVSGSVLSWTLGALAPGDSGSIDLVSVVNPSVLDTIWVRNTATLTTSAAGASPVPAISAQVALIGPLSAGVALDLTAAVLDVAIGEVIPFTAVVRNVGSSTLNQFVVAVTLPPGGRYAGNSATGIDSLRVVGDQLLLYSSAPLAPGASRSLHFGVALTSSSTPLVKTSATATAQTAGATATSLVAVAGVQVRRAWPMETRTAIGKVWVDTEGDGAQGPEDAGLAGIEVWTEDGEVATTDATGKFSFTNLRPGRHTFRIDSRSLAGDYRVAGDDIRTIESSGWTTPRIDFRVLPLGALLSDVRQPVDIRFSAAPVGPDRRQGTLSSVPVGFPSQSRASLRWDLSVRSHFELPEHTLLGFSPALDSIMVSVGGAAHHAVWLSRDLVLPEARPGTEIRIVAWSAQDGDSVAVKLRSDYDAISAKTQVGSGPDGDLLKAWVSLGSQTLPPAAALPDAAALQLVLKPLRASWPEVTYVIPSGWRPVAGSTQVGGIAARDPKVEQDGDGRVRLRWRFPAGWPATITVLVSTDPIVSSPTEIVSVPTARTAASRAAERRVNLTRGPGLQIVAPVDGAVLPGDRIYVGVKGEPGALVRLYDGAVAIDSAPIRVDGLLDFIAVPLARGPHLLRTRVVNSWGSERWDSIAVHVPGLPARFEAPNRLALPADGRSVAVMKVRVVDTWGVPVVQPAYVTVSANGAEPVGDDVDQSSVGRQLLSSASGRLDVSVRPGHTVGSGALLLKSGDAKATIQLDLSPEVRPLTLTGGGSFGVGASPDAYGAITARGRLDTRTSLTVTLDSRRLDAGRNVFGRQHDPLEDAQYPILGDASHVDTRAASPNWFAARLERGFDWLSVGDVATNDFAAGLSLAGYRRAVSGVAGRLTTGPVTWSGFGSMTTQSLRQLQIRGVGASGPYELGPDVLPGTEQLRLETRAVENPERAIVTQGLTRYVDYQIDYATGTLLFKQPVPAADAQGNPVFVVATFEAASGGERKLVAGGRAALNLNPMFGGRSLDSLRLGITAVNAEQTTDPFRLLGADIRALRLGGLDLGAEVAYAEQGDSTGLATAARAGYGTGSGPLTFGASYMNVGREFTNPSNVALRPGTTELTVRGAFKVGPSTLRASHSWQDFEVEGISRQSTRVGLIQSFGHKVELDAGVAHRREESSVLSPTSGEAQSGEAKLTVKPSDDIRVWAEGRHRFSGSGDMAQPDFWGIGSTYKVTSGVGLEAGQRFVSPSTGEHYAVSSVGVRAEVGYGTQAWGSYQLSGGSSGARNAAVLGLNNRMRLAPGLGMNLMFERRIGIDRAGLADPVRAAPFIQAEEDYWSAGVGVELLPEQAPYRLTARGEYKDGVLQSNRLVSLAGDVTFNSSFSLLSRQEFSQAARPGEPLARRMSSLWGLAFRPAATDRLNALAKFQWSDDRNPIAGGVLVRNGQEQKLIGSADLIWNPLKGTELGTRYALRWTDAVSTDATGTPVALRSRADYAGANLRVDLNSWLALRGDGRLLLEHTSGSRRWDAAPSIALRLINGLELQAGYRFGDLRDPDFSVRGGHGLFLTMSASLTEKQFVTAADFWRTRF